MYEPSSPSISGGILNEFEMLAQMSHRHSLRPNIAKLLLDSLKSELRDSIASAHYLESDSTDKPIPRPQGPRYYLAWHCALAVYLVTWLITVTQKVIACLFVSAVSASERQNASAISRLFNPANTGNKRAIISIDILGRRQWSRNIYHVLTLSHVDSSIAGDYLTLLLVLYADLGTLDLIYQLFLQLELTDIVAAWLACKFRIC